MKSFKKYENIGKNLLIFYSLNIQIKLLLDEPVLCGIKRKRRYSNEVMYIYVDTYVHVYSETKKNTHKHLFQ
jgi:hypothetical protein